MERSAGRPLTRIRFTLTCNFAISRSVLTLRRFSAQLKPDSPLPAEKMVTEFKAMEQDQMKEDELYGPFPWKGHKQACGRIAGSPAAADIERLRRIRDGKLFCAKGVDWTGFCKQY